MTGQAAPAARERWLQLALNGALFGLCYPLTNALAHRLATAGRPPPGVRLAWEALPFLPWMVLPYMTSAPLFMLSFLLVRGRAGLSALSRRTACTTVAACLVFAAFPLRFELARPLVDAALPAWLFAGLAAVDQPYNQLPSLHVAYCVIFWPALRSALPRAGTKAGMPAKWAAALARSALAGWLLLVAASTVLTWQHHALDVAGGALLGLLALYALPMRAAPPGLTVPAASPALPAPLDADAATPPASPVSFCYALLAALALLAWFALGGPWWLYLCASLLLVARAYRRGHADFLRKRGGVHPWPVRLLYAPYLLGYLLTWHLVRLRERHRPPFTRHSAGLWVGRRLTDAEAARLPPGCAVIDLAAELVETPALRRPPYQHFALLDLRAPDADSARPILDAIAGHAARGRPVYLHCAMGYRRSREVAALYTELAIQPDQEPQPS